MPAPAADGDEQEGEDDEWLGRALDTERRMKRLLEVYHKNTEAQLVAHINRALAGSEARRGRQQRAA